MQNELKQISLRWISIFFDSESEYVKYNKQSDFLSSYTDGMDGNGLKLEKIDQVFAVWCYVFQKSSKN